MEALTRFRILGPLPCAFITGVRAPMVCHASEVAQTAIRLHIFKSLQIFVEHNTLFLLRIISLKTYTFLMFVQV